MAKKPQTEKASETIRRGMAENAVNLALEIMWQLDDCETVEALQEFQRTINYKFEEIGFIKGRKASGTRMDKVDKRIAEGEAEGAYLLAMRYIKCINDGEK